MFLIVSLIIIIIVFSAVVSKRWNIPLILISLAIGIIFGSDVTGLIYFDDTQLTKEIANIVLIFVLFAGGFDTKYSNLKPVIRPTIILATVGVLLTANIAAVVFCVISGWSLLKSMLLCTIISSTDAAAVFSILHNRSINKNVSLIAEIESAANDPIAITSTIFIIQLMINLKVSVFISIFLFVWQLLGGIALGIIIGFIGVHLFNKIRNIDVGYFYLLLIGIILLSFGLTDLCKASGIVSVFFTGLVMGNKKLPYKNGISSFTEILSFISNVMLYVLLGLLVIPRNFSKIWLLGVLLFLVVTFIARPITVFICTFFANLSLKDQIFLSWSGIRGSVPIVLATYPAAAGLDDQHQIFNIVFFAVTLSIIIQGTTIGKVVNILKLSSKRKSEGKATMDLVTIHDSNYELIEIFIDDETYKGECKISDLSLPLGTTITMINRSNSIIAPSGQTTIYPGDILFVLVDNSKIEECTNAILRMFLKK